MGRRQRRAAGERADAPARDVAIARPSPLTPPALASTLARVHIHLVSALLGAGLALCWCGTVAELRFHTASPARALALPLATLGVGGAGGVILAVALLRRASGSLARQINSLDAAGGTLCGFLLLPCAAAWGAAVLYLVFLESIRAAFAGALVVPPALLITLLWFPVLIALAAAGATCAVACAALHGWKRELGLTRRYQSAIWPALLLAASAAAIADRFITPNPITPLFGVAAIFAAAIVATIRTGPAVTIAPQIAYADTPAPAGGGAAALACVTLAGANLAGAWLVSLRPDSESLEIAGITAVLCTAAATAFAGPVHRLRGAVLGPVYLCAIATVCWIAPAWSPPAAAPWFAITRLAAIGICAALAILVAARQLAVHLGGTRRGLAACIVFAGIGALVGGMISPGPPPQPETQPSSAASFEQQIAHWFTNVPAIHCVTVTPTPTARSTAAWSAGLLLDLAPHTVDAVLVQPPVGDEFSSYAAERCARRWFRALRAGGRVIAISPPPRTAEALIWDWKHSGATSPARAFRATWQSTPGLDVLIIGTDVPAYLAAALPVDAPQPILEEVTGYRQFLTLRSR